MIENLECPVCPQLANECREVLRDWHGKKLTPQFDVELCHIAVRNDKCLTDYRWRPEPSKPYEYEKYLSFSPKDKTIYRDQHPTFLIQGKVAVYLNDRDMIININNRNLNQLKDWHRLPRFDVDTGVGLSEVARIEVEKLINTYSGRNN